MMLRPRTALVIARFVTMCVMTLVAGLAIAAGTPAPAFAVALEAPGPAPRHATLAPAEFPGIAQWAAVAVDDSDPDPDPVPPLATIAVRAAPAAPSSASIAPRHETPLHFGAWRIAPARTPPTGPRR